ncbi:cohesin domain-containing protein [Patescibacteria group bacterium]|nr:cohesin domain-containing protein [Patescibacteria group bacterium]
MKKSFIIVFLIIVFSLFYFDSVLAQTVSLSPTSQNVARSTNFSLTINISSVTNLFGVAFDLNFNPSLIDYVSATEGTFLSSGCQTSLMTAENPAGKLVFGITRLGASCGGVSGSGILAILNFRSLIQDGSNILSFSNNSLCLLNGLVCNYVVGTWNGAAVTVMTVVDTTPPAAPTGVVVG